MINSVLILLGKFISLLSRLANRGNGSTWPGHIALSINKNFIKDILATNQLQTILVVGTNGKTTTSKLIQAILEQDKKRVFQNASGANLLNGIASTLLLKSDISGKLPYDFAIFEIDENTLPLVLKELTPHYIVALNLFRDQLDRYGEVNTIATKWHAAMENLPSSTTLVLNADDPQIAYLGKDTKAKTEYFGLEDKTLTTKSAQHAADSTYCPNCEKKLVFSSTYYAHLGEWKCTSCKYEYPKLSLSKTPDYPLSGVYNIYNTLAAVLLAKTVGIDEKTISAALQNFKPAFGRQEMIEIDGKKVQLFLAKNPASFNQSLRTAKELGGKNVLLVLNDRVPDGRDVSWIWDIDMEDYVESFDNITVSGDRAYDMALRIKYSEKNQDTNSKKQTIFPNLSVAIKNTLEKTPENETLYILPTYSAMLEVRKILTGKKIL